MVLYNAYRIVRQVGATGEESSGRALYFVQRPDGSECCRDVPWAQVERVVARDMRSAELAARLPPSGPRRRDQ